MTAQSKRVKKHDVGDSLAANPPHRYLPLIARHRVATLVAFAALLFSMSWVGVPVLAELETTGQDTLAINSESSAVGNFLADAGLKIPGQYLAVLVPIDDRHPRAIQRRILATQRVFAQVSGVIATKSFIGITSRNKPDEPLQRIEARDQRFLTKDKRWAAIVGFLGGGQDGNPEIAAAVGHAFDDSGNLIAGELPRLEETDRAIAQDLRRGDLLALPLLLIVLLWAFKRFPLVALPLATAGFTLLATLVVIRALHLAGLDLSLLGAAPVAGIALGMSVDYSLLLVGRCTEAAVTTNDPITAVDRGVRSVSRTIATCVGAIVFAVGPLSMVPIPAVYSLSIACTCCVLLAGFAALSLTPAGLVLSQTITPKDRTEEGVSPSPANSRFWLRVPSWAMRHPALSIALGVGVLGILTIPALGLRVGSVPPTQVLPDTPTARAESLLADRFPRSLTNERFSVLVQAPEAEDSSNVNVLIRQIKRSAGVDKVSPPRQLSPGLSMLEVQSRFPRESPGAFALVGRVRSLSGPSSVLVSSTSADIMDREHMLKVRMLPVLAASVAGIALVLFLLSASFVIPLKLILLTAGTMGATFGIVALLFQDLAASSDQVVFDSTQILTLGVLGAALVTDYGVFVAARIVHNHELGFGDEDAISLGLASTGPIVSTAAVVFTVAVGSFLLSDITLVRQLCVGLIAAVLIDAMLVRALLVPALMKALGPYNWWLPGWAAKIHRWLTQ